MKFAIAVFLGVVSAGPLTIKDQPVWGLRSVQDHRTDSQVQKAYGDHSTKSSNANQKEYTNLLQLDSESESESSDDEMVQFLGAHEHGRPDNEYKRVIPDRFSKDDDDIFMRSMIANYALEGQNKDDSPNGSFWMDETTSMRAAREVLSTHKGLTGPALDKYLATYFAKAWGHFDVNKSGTIEVVRTPEFMRFLCSD